MTVFACMLWQINIEISHLWFGWRERIKEEEDAKTKANALKWVKFFFLCFSFFKATHRSRWMIEICIEMVSVHPSNKRIKSKVPSKKWHKTSVSQWRALRSLDKWMMNAGVYSQSNAKQLFTSNIQIWTQSSRQQKEQRLNLVENEPINKKPIDF